MENDSEQYNTTPLQSQERDFIWRPHQHSTQALPLDPTHPTALRCDVWALVWWDSLVAWSSIPPSTHAARMSTRRKNQEKIIVVRPTRSTGGGRLCPAPLRPDQGYSTRKKSEPSGSLNGRIEIQRQTEERAIPSQFEVQYVP